MAKAEKSGKSKRKQSDGKKLQRAACRRRATQRRLACAQQQELRARHNLKLIQDGELTPWQQACAERAARRLLTCGKCRRIFEEDKCPHCGDAVNLAGMWKKRHMPEQLPAA